MAIWKVIFSSHEKECPPIVFVHSDMYTNSVANNINYVCPQSDKDVTLGINDGVDGFGDCRV